MIYCNGNFVYTIGGIPVGSGSSTPPPPPPPDKVNLTVGGVPGILSASAQVPFGDFYLGGIPWTDNSGQLTGMPYGATVHVKLSAASGYNIANPVVSGLSASSMSAGSSTAFITGYMTADTLASATASAVPETPHTSTIMLYANPGYPVYVSAYVNHVYRGSASSNSTSTPVALEFTSYSADSMYLEVVAARKSGYTANISSNFGSPTGTPTSDASSTRFGRLTVPYDDNAKSLSAYASAGLNIVTGSGYTFSPWSGKLTASYPYYEVGVDYRGIVGLTWYEASEISSIAPGTVWKAIPDSASGDSTYIQMHKYALMPTAFSALYISGEISAKRTAYDGRMVAFPAALTQSSRYDSHTSYYIIDSLSLRTNSADTQYITPHMGGTAKCTGNYPRMFSFDIESPNNADGRFQVFGDGKWGFSGVAW